MHEFMNYSCVVKLLDLNPESDTFADSQQIRNEAAAGQRVRHPNVVRVLESDLNGPSPYFVMEYVEGADLGKLMAAETALDWRQVLEIAVSVADGLAAIHDAGLVHRDIKPENLILGIDGQARVADLGIAAVSGRPVLPGAGHSLAGTAQYAAPEQFATDCVIDARVDVYSLGATLFHLLSGTHVDGSQGTLRRLFGDNPTLQWPSRVEAETPTWLRRSIEQMVAVSPRNRPADMTQVLQSLRRGHERVTARRTHRLAPRGVVVLPFSNAAGNADEWLGFAIADTLARRISEIPGTFVANTEQFQQHFARRDVRGESHSDRMLNAGRIVGADRFIEGVFEKNGETISIRVSLLNAGDEAPALVRAVAGQLSSINDLQHALYLAVAEALHLSTETDARLSSQIRTVALAAQEKTTLGRQAYLRGEYAKAIRFAEEAFELDPQVVEPLSYIGVCHARLGNYEQSEAYHRQLESFALERSEKRLLVESHANLGVMYYFRGDYEASVRMQLSAARIAEELSMTAELAFISNNLGFAQFRLSRAEEAENAFRKAIEIHGRFGALGALIAPYNGLGNVLVEERRFGEAQSFYAEALALAEEIGDRTNVGLTHLHIGRAATLEARYAEAKRELAIALTVFEDANFWNGLMRAHEYMVDLNMRLGDLNEALRGVEKRILLARKYGNARLEATALRQKADVLRASGNIEHAAEVSEQAVDCERRQSVNST